MKDISIVFIDLDGTLKKNNGLINDKIFKIFKRLKEHNVHIVFTSGRGVRYCENISKQFGSSCYVIGSNGAEIYNYVSNNFLFRSSIKKDTIVMLSDLIKKYNFDYVINCGIKRYSNKEITGSGFTVITDINSICEDIDQVVIQTVDISKYELFRKDIDKFNDIKIINETKDKDSTYYYSFDVVNNEVSKGNAAKILCDYLNININNSMGFGDSNNDIDLLKTVNYKVAVSNASEELKSIANFVTLSNDADGVLIVLERLFEDIMR